MFNDEADNPYTMYATMTYRNRVDASCGGDGGELIQGEVIQGEVLLQAHDPVASLSSPPRRNPLVSCSC
jgi:uncharacterized protein involved in propanediol utilization